MTLVQIIIESTAIAVAIIIGNLAATTWLFFLQEQKKARKKAKK